MKAMATTELVIVMAYLDLLSEERAFQMLIAPSSPAEARRRSLVSSVAVSGETGCQAKEVMMPWWALKE